MYIRVTSHKYTYIYMHVHVPTLPTCTRERNPSSGEHVYVPGRTPSSVNICHMWTRERTLKRPQGVLHVNPREDTLNWRARAGAPPIHPRGHPHSEHIHIYAPKRTPSNIHTNKYKHTYQWRYIYICYIYLLYIIYYVYYQLGGLSVVMVAAPGLL